ncbi:MAG: hypothetical protein IPG80_10170, partial [Anaerolineales bacterium]|uniref:WD40 repeat domain-containing protein n=1 Tax=Candidatus Villigracilis vicinus TaxID=3140679 RepID=UPI0031353FC0|nr:hypothetical protein [Anaerolineales bacterium]
MVAAIIAGVIVYRTQTGYPNEAIASTAQAAEALAIQEKDHAENEAKLATSRELAAASLSNLDIDPELSILLALQAEATIHTIESETSLRRGLVVSQLKFALNTKNQNIQSIAFSPDGTHLATAGNGGYIQIWDTMTGLEVLELDSVPEYTDIT